MRIAVAGVCLKRPHGPTGWAWARDSVPQGDPDTLKWQAGGLVRANDAVGEFLALLMALRRFPHIPLTVQSSSSYLIGACGPWKASWQRNNYKRDDGTTRPNANLIVPIHYLLDNAETPVTFEKVPDRYDAGRFPLHEFAAQQAAHAARIANLQQTEVILNEE